MWNAKSHIDQVAHNQSINESITDIPQGEEEYIWLPNYMEALRQGNRKPLFYHFFFAANKTNGLLGFASSKCDIELHIPLLYFY